MLDIITDFQSSFLANDWPGKFTIFNSFSIASRRLRFYKVFDRISLSQSEIDIL